MVEYQLSDGDVSGFVNLHGVERWKQIVTENLIRKRAEHNNCEISTLEEVSLHQQDIEKIEHIDRWCRDLKILYLQSNLIPKIENVGKLKKLEYLNLALNNVERIENLEACESLKKLDLTVNFVGELTSIECLKNLYQFEELYLTGNPCTEYDGYRDYVIAALPSLKKLDGVTVEKSERIKAVQDYSSLKESIIIQQEKHRRKREKEKKDAEKKKEIKENRDRKAGFDGRWYTDINQGDKQSSEEVTVPDEKGDKSTEEEDAKFWEEKVPFTPESRIEVHDQLQKQKMRGEKEEKDPPKRERRLFADDGTPFNINEAKIDFSLLDEEEKNNLVLDLAIYKHLDTSLLDVDVQTTYVKVVVKRKELWNQRQPSRACAPPGPWPRPRPIHVMEKVIGLRRGQHTLGALNLERHVAPCLLYLLYFWAHIFQLVLPEEVKPDSSNAKRSQITGHLMITMPKANPVIKAPKPVKCVEEEESRKVAKNNKPRQTCERLEVDPSKAKKVEYGNIVSEKKTVPPLGHKEQKKTEERPNSEDFVDDPDVPPLI